MADNYLEKKYEELQSGKKTIRKSSPSLDTLIGRVVDSTGSDPGYMVKEAQLEAAVRSARKLGLPVVMQADEGTMTVTVRTDNPIHAGECILAIRLKAAELHLKTSATCTPDGWTVSFFR